MPGWALYAFQQGIAHRSPYYHGLKAGYAQRAHDRLERNW